ncbi:MAG TPA: cobalamin-independent methionine synthase II family protein [Thermomicrobiales bacterium]|nr:cobalamin-independent methionine synthase II family protein [Thermomicrobiales bacterium]
MLTSKDRIQVSHVGSLPRPDALREANAARLAAGGALDGFDQILADAVKDVVRRQKDAGITVPNDGEYGKAMSGKVDYGAWWSYSFQRLGGLEIREGGLDVVPPQRSEPGNVRLSNFADRRDWNIFHDAYNDPTAGIALGDTAARAFPVQVGPVTYIGQEAVQSDIASMKVAMAANGFEEGFITAVSPGSAARIGNEYYRTEEEFIFACADALREEYTAIIDAGLILQIDDPSIAENFDQIVPEPSIEDYRAFTQIRVDALNHALEGLPADRVRFHLCWGSWHGPHTTDIEFKHIVDLMLRINAGAYTFEAANARHEHEWKVWETVALPEGKLILPGVVGHATNVVEHPELVADRIERFARLVGRENVIASTDCGLGGRIHPQIAWAKLEALAQGAELATQRLWA